MRPKAVSQLRWPDQGREVWFSLEENHEKAFRFGLHQLRNVPNGPSRPILGISCHLDFSMVSPRDLFRPSFSLSLF